MDPLQATMIAMVLAKEILHFMQSNQNISEEQLADMIALNLIRIQSIKATIEKDIADGKLT